MYAAHDTLAAETQPRTSCWLVSYVGSTTDRLPTGRDGFRQYFIRFRYNGTKRKRI